MCKTYQSEHAAEYSDSFLFISICVIRVVLGFLVLFSFRFRTTSQHHLNRRHLLWMVVFGRGRTDRHSFDQMSEHTFNSSECDGIQRLWFVVVEIYTTKIVSDVVSAIKMKSNVLLDD